MKIWHPTWFRYFNFQFMSGNWTSENLDNFIHMDGPTTSGRLKTPCMPTSFEPLPSSEHVCLYIAAVTASTHRCCYSLATQYILYYIVSMLICNISGGDRATWKLRGSLSYYPFKVCLDSSHVNSQPLGRLRVIGSLTSWFTLASPPGNVTLKGNDKRVSVSQVVPKLSAPGLSARLLNVYVVCMQGFCSNVGYLWK